MNPFFAMQQRLADLLAGSPYFAGCTADQILTEKIADLEFQVLNGLLQLGFGVVITTASGKPVESNYEALVTVEDLNISILHNPTVDPDHNALDAVAAAIAAVHGASVQIMPPPAPRPHDTWAVTGHQRRADAPSGCTVHEIFITGGLRLL